MAQRWAYCDEGSGIVRRSERELHLYSGGGYMSLDRFTSKFGWRVRRLGTWSRTLEDIYSRVQCGR